MPQNDQRIVGDHFVSNMLWYLKPPPPPQPPLSARWGSLSWEPRKGGGPGKGLERPPPPPLHKPMFPQPRGQGPGQGQEQGQGQRVAMGHDLLALALALALGLCFTTARVPPPPATHGTRYVTLTTVFRSISLPSDLLVLAPTKPNQTKALLAHLRGAKHRT